MDRTVWIGLGVLVVIILIAGYVLAGQRTPPRVIVVNPSENPAETYTPNPTATSTSPSASPTGVTKNITVTAKEFSFSPATITVNKGDNVVVTFKNSGTISHNLTIGDLNLATNTIAPGQSATLTFVATQPGTFAFYCSVDGHRDMGMQGTLEVK